MKLGSNYSHHTTLSKLSTTFWKGFCSWSGCGPCLLYLDFADCLECDNKMEAGVLSGNLAMHRYRESHHSVHIPGTEILVFAEHART